MIRRRIPRGPAPRPRLRAGRFLRILAPTAIAALLALGGAAYGSFPNDPPNDPSYAPAEQGGAPTCAQKSANDEQYYLYSFIPQCAVGASDPENASGMSLDKAWRVFNPGSPRTLIAYIEGGINWHGGDAKELANKVFLNKGELPPPTTPHNDGVLNARDYADTTDYNNNGVVDPEDIIKRFSDGRDDDHNGYVDDISGWDFYNHQNDPATLDSAYDHANGQMKQAAAQTNNHIGEAGVCPKCMLLPVKAGAEALDRTDDLAQAWLYAADMNTDVIVSVSADLGYSTFMSQAIDNIWRRGTIMVQASNDFDSTDHQGGMFHQHVLPGNGMVANNYNVAQSTPSDNATITTYRARSGFTSWGTHNVFTAETQGGTTSESTPTVGGVMGMVVSEGKIAAARHRISRPLSPDEAIQVVRATSSDVNDPNSNWPSKKGFDLQYGYGRPNVFKAMKAVSKGRIPPEAWLTAPRWYSLYDPARTQRVPVSGHVAAPRSSHYQWKLQFAPGAEPSNSKFITASRGSGSSAFSGRLGSIDLGRIPASFWSHAYHLSQTKTLETSEQYTVTLRLQVTDANGRLGEERRTIAVHHDPTMRRHFPVRIGPGGDSEPQLADLQGRGHEAAIFGDSDGRVHAIDGRTGRELPGFPVSTNRTRVTKRHRGVNPGHEPIVANVAVGDLNHNGRQWIVGTTTTGRVYVWDEHGNRRAGWPKLMRRGVKRIPIPRPVRGFTRPRIAGATAPPVLYDLNGDGKLEIIQAAWDGNVHVWKPNGKRLAGFPLKIKPPNVSQEPNHFFVNDQKLDMPPAIADLDGDGKPELIVRSQFNSIVDAGLQPDMVSYLDAFHANGTRVAGWPVSMQGIVGYYGSAQEFITEGANAPSAADIHGDGSYEVAADPAIFSPVYLFNGDGSQNVVYGPVPSATAGLLTGQTPLTDVLGPNPPEDTPVSFTTSGAFGRFGSAGTLAFVQPGSGGATVAGGLLLPGSGLPINSYMRAFDATSAAVEPGFPALSQGLDFIGGAVMADVSGDGKPEIIEAGDSSALHAFAEGGGQAAQFPKFMTGWMFWSPTVGDLNGDGRNDVVAATREGYLMAWRTPGKANGGNDEWWSWRHDERNTGQYGLDTRPPGVLRRAFLKIDGRHLTFTAPGDDWYSGKVDRYRVTIGRAHHPRKHRTVAATASAGKRQTVRLPNDWNAVRIVAIDDAGNRSRTLKFAHGPPV